MGLQRRLGGLLALLTILGILIGLPLVLLAVGADPFSGGGLPTWEAARTALTTPDDGHLLLAVIKIAGWAAWAFMTVSIVVEIVARVRGVRAPRLPGLRMTQHAARGLVGAVMLLFLTVPANASPAQAAPVATSTTQQSAATTQAAPQAAPKAASTVEDTQPATVNHTVRQGETLWSIAQARLGDGRRYEQIVALNPHLLHGEASFIKAGWVLTVPAPAPAHGGVSHPVLVEAGDTLSGIAADELGDADRYLEIFEASRDLAQPGGAHLTDPDLIQPGWTVAVPAEAATGPDRPQMSLQKEPSRSGPSTTEEVAPSTDAAAQSSATQAAPESLQGSGVAPQLDAALGSGSSPAASPETAEHLEEDSAWVSRTSTGVGALLAAGVLALLATRRRTQQRRRRAGQRLRMPEGNAAAVEQDLRATADSLSVETVDLALRTLARDCAAAGVALPVVRAARLTATAFDLYLVEAARLATPWSATADNTVWTLELARTAALAGDDLSSIPAPYPALVTIGHDEEDGHVFLNLECLGALGVTGADSDAREILAALAVELATSTWADDLQVTTVGAFPELEDALQTGRIRYLPTVGRVLDELSQRAADDRRTLAQEGVPDLNTARVTGAAPDAWSPEIVLLAGDVTDKQRAQIDQLVSGLPRVALAAVTTGDSAGEWGLDLFGGHSAGWAVLNPIGLQLRPQRLPAEQYGDLLQIASLADVEELSGDGEPEPTLTDVASIAPAEEPASSVPRPYVPLEHLEAAEVAEVPPPPSPDLAAASAEPATAVSEPNDSPESPQASLRGEDPPGELPVDTDDRTPSPIAESQVAPVQVADATASVQPMPLPAPRILLLGPVEMLNAGGKVEPSKRARLLEYAAYLALHPGATHTAIDDAIWPDRRTEDNLSTRNPATSKLRRWVGLSPEGEEYLPRHQAGEGYAFLPAVSTDVNQWDALLEHNPLNAPTENLEAALQLVRGAPFEGTHRKRYAWAEPLKQRLISEIVDASYELGKRRLMEGRWRAAEQAVVVGLLVEPAQELLWRLRILAAHESRNPAAETEAIERLLTITDQLESELEPETEQLLHALKNPGSDLGQLVASAI